MERVDREDLVMGKCVDGHVFQLGCSCAEEASVVDRGAVIDDLYKSFVIVGIPGGFL